MKILENKNKKVGVFSNSEVREKSRKDNNEYMNKKTVFESRQTSFKNQKEHLTNPHSDCPQKEKKWRTKKLNCFIFHTIIFKSWNGIRGRHLLLDRVSFHFNFWNLTVFSLSLVILLSFEYVAKREGKKRKENGIITSIIYGD